MKQRIKVIIVAFCFTPVFPVYATRSITIPGVRNISAHAGGGGCVTADYWQPGASPPNPDVIAAYHNFEFTFTNITSNTQRVTLKLLPGSSTHISYSSPGYVVPDLPGANISTTSPYSYTFTLLGNQTFLVGSRFYCTANRCKIELPKGTIVAGSDDPSPPGKNCLQMASLTSWGIDIAEDSGGIVASMSTSIHRNCGIKDHYISPPVAIQILNGRAF